MDAVVAKTMQFAAAVAHLSDDAICAAVGGDDADALGRTTLGVFAARWARNGFPRVTLGHRHAAALMATNANPAALGPVEAPWDAFWIAVPDGLVALPRPAGAGVLRVVHAVVLEGATGEVVMQFGDHTGLYYTAAAASVADFGEFRGEGPGAEVMARLVLGVVLELTAHRAAGARGLGPAPVKRDRRGAPECRTFALTRDVRVDCRAAVRDYVRGASATAPTVQALVRGHWKRQPCGPAAADRKFIFVEPYWRGPEDAPVAVRAHVLPEAR